MSSEEETSATEGAFQEVVSEPVKEVKEKKAPKPKKEVVEVTPAEFIRPAAPVMSSDETFQENSRAQKLRRAMEKIAEAKCASCNEGAAGSNIMSALDTASNAIEVALALTKLAG